MSISKKLSLAVLSLSLIAGSTQANPILDRILGHLKGSQQDNELTRREITQILEQRSTRTTRTPSPLNTVPTTPKLELEIASNSDQELTVPQMLALLAKRLEQRRTGRSTPPSPLTSPVAMDPMDMDTEGKVE